MSTVEELRPGDLVTNGPMSAVFIGRTDHPLYEGLQLVVWRLRAAPVGRELSLDALRADQEVGDIAKPDGPEARKERLRHALLHRSQR